jgi:hypothetical protein
LPRIANFLNSSHMDSLRSDSIAGGARHRSGRHQPVRPARTITHTMRIRALRPAVTDLPIYTLRNQTNTRFMARRRSRPPPSPRGSDATSRTDRRSGVGMEGNATTRPLANLLVRLCKPADAECMGKCPRASVPCMEPIGSCSRACVSHAKGGCSRQRRPEAP